MFFKQFWLGDSRINLIKMLFTQSIAKPSTTPRLSGKIYPDSRDQIEILVSCRDLKLAGLSPGGVSISVSLYTERNGVFELTATTEQQTKNITNPNFTESFIIDFFFAVQQNLKFEVKLKTRSNDKILGEIHTSLGCIIGSNEEQIVYNIPCESIYNRESIGKLIVRRESAEYVSHTAKMTIRANDLKLPRKSILKKRDDELILRFARPVVENNYATTYESEIRQGVNPRWSDVEIGIQKLCNGDYTKNIKLQILCAGSGSIIGESFFTINDLLSDTSLDHQFDLICLKTGNKCGKITIYDFNIMEKPHFLDYLRSGLKFNFVLGIDYTSSNKDPSHPESLHYIKSNGLNDYEKAISGVFDILLNYNRRKEVSMFGFGGIPKFPNYESQLTNHIFPLTGDSENPSAFGLEGILKVYRNSLDQVQFASPSYLEPMINLTKQMALQVSLKELNEYTMLIILTDGKCHDMQDTLNAIIESSGLPLSVIIVGVGNGDFRKMDILDGSQGIQNFKGEIAERDLVQFVPFEHLQHNPDLLAKYVLKKIPEQIVSYMVGSGKYPKSAALSRVLRLEQSENDHDKRAWECGYEEDLMSQEKNRSFSTMNSQSELSNNLNNGFLKAFEPLKMETKRISILMKADGSFMEDDDTIEDDEDDLQIYQKNQSFCRYSLNHGRVFGTVSKTFDMMKNKNTYLTSVDSQFQSSLRTVTCLSSSPTKSLFKETLETNKSDQTPGSSKNFFNF